MRPSAVVRNVWCQAPSLLRPPTSWGGRGIQGPLPVRPGRCRWPHCVRSCELALAAVGAAGGRSPGGAPCAVAGGV